MGGKTKFLCDSASTKVTEVSFNVFLQEDGKYLAFLVDDRFQVAALGYTPIDAVYRLLDGFLVSVGFADEIKIGDTFYRMSNSSLFTGRENGT